MKNFSVGMFAWAVMALMPAQGSADMGYLTTYSHHIEKGELELMLMNDLTSPSSIRKEREGLGDYFSHMIELDYSVTDQLVVEFMPEWFEDVNTGKSMFTGFRYEVRYKLFHDDVPLNPQVYAEYEDLHIATRYKMEVSGWVNPPYTITEKEEDRERILESRLILSQDVGPATVAANWINESDMNNGVTAFGYSLGALFTYPFGERTEGYVHHDVEAGKTLYQCPMHPSNTSDKPGKCPICGMTLIPIEKEKDSSHGSVMVSTLGFEFFGALGDTLAFALDPSRQEHYFQPSIMLHWGNHAMITTGFAIGLSKASDNLTRLNFGYEF